MKKSIHLTSNPKQSSDIAVRALLNRLLSDLRSHELAIVQNKETESLHDFRVAVRKTRTLLGQFKTVFSKKSHKRFDLDWVWLNQLSGTARDLDVHLSQFEALKANLPDHLQESLDPLKLFLKQSAKASHLALNEQLNSKRYRRFMKDWQRFIQTKHHSKQSATPIFKSARKRIAKLYRSMLKQGSKIDPETSAEVMHKLRKTAKKLRYLLDMLQIFYPKAKLLGKKLKNIQDLLGQYQDIQVSIEKLDQFSHEIKEIEPQTQTSIALILDHLKNQQPQLKQDIKANLHDL